jgi:hypothetical protein
MTNAEVRTELRRLLQAFIDQNCQYDSHENKACADLLKSLWQVDPRCEEFNEKFPNHGKPLKQ